MPGPDAQTRLRRLLFLVPYVAENPGQKVDDVAAALGVTRAALLHELDLLTMVGRPPFQPDDFIDIYVDDDRVYVDLDQRLSRPPRLTASEGVALAAAAELMRPADNVALTSALRKLERALPASLSRRFREMSKQLDLTTEAPNGFSTLSQAIAEHREVELEYVAQARTQSERRRVNPLELFSHRGQWYLFAHCHSRGDARLFRLDRISATHLTEQKFQPPAEPVSPQMPEVLRATEWVNVRFSAEAAPYVAERFGVEHVTRLPNGEIEVRVSGDNEQWLIQWIMSFGGNAWVSQPQWAKDAVRNHVESLVNRGNIKVT